MRLPMIGDKIDYDNLSSMVDFKELNQDELTAIDKVCKIFKSLNFIPCTSCHYCIEENNNALTNDGHGKASDCIKCGKCEKVCPQHLKIRELFVKVRETFEK